MLKNFSASKKILFAFSAVVALTLVAYAVAFGSMYNIQKSGQRVGAHLAPLVDAAMEIKLSAAQAHLVMEEVMAGSVEVDMSDVQAAIAEARFYADSILNGGENDEGVFFPPEAPEVRQNIEQVLVGITAFEQAADQRYSLKAQDTGVGSGADIEFDALFDSLESGIDRLGETVEINQFQRLVGDARYQITLGHLQTEEILGGDLNEDFNVALSAFDAAASQLQAAATLAGIGPETTSAIDTILPDVARFRELAINRHASAKELAVRSEQITADFDAGYQRFVSLADEAETAIQAQMQAGLLQQKQISFRAVMLSVSIGLVTLGLVMVFYRWLDNSLGRRMKVIADAMENVTHGDLDVSVPDWGTKDEVGLLCGKVEDMRKAFSLQKQLEHSVEAERKLAEDGKKRAEAMQLAAEEARQLAEQHSRTAQARAKAADDFGKEFARVVTAARDGEFAERIATKTGDADLDQIGVALNDMLASMQASLGEVMQVMAALAQGDLRSKMQGDTKGAFAQLQESINGTLSELTSMATSISTVSRDMTNEISILAQSASQLSQRSMSQAASLEETNAAIAAMSETVKSTEGASELAAQQVQKVSAQAQMGGDVVKQAIAAVRRIDENSRRVAGFTKVIDDISFQTNLLALNAGVEAARAGEAGKGFAVVAQEVRALAQRANEAAAGIGGLIEESSRGVQEGVHLVTQTGEVLDEILEAIANVAELSSHIAEASRDQSTGISDVLTVINDLDRMTQQNAAMAEEGTALSGKLRARAGKMEDLIGFFKTDAIVPLQDVSQRLGSRAIART